MITGPETILNSVLDLVYFHPEDDHAEPAIPFHRVDGSGRLVVLLGENASGKSFVRRLVTLICRKEKVECISISMEGRAGGMSGMRSFVYGCEEWQATGQNSAGTITTGIRTCRGRDSAHVVFWDEPDLGLSDSWAAGAGEAICKFALTPPEHTKAIFIITHNRALVRELLPARPFYVHLGSTNPPKSIEAWLERPVEVRDIEKLAEESHRRFQRIQAILASTPPGARGTNSAK